ncbi:aspartic peptidase A1 family, Aspartic peptidase domain protein [Artemisia annua]|uniref:Aspartic peptidase A1 family, Aspartic peptidase domain protein n=1 Tax=Artemisia annua TaxID=35608 RepID=A0A2U1NAA2_ARTAN|nr:aspartic peptidase A1 family, Aspartic peptidase domain protein [Artemisia annua]
MSSSSSVTLLLLIVLLFQSSSFGAQAKLPPFPAHDRGRVDIPIALRHGLYYTKVLLGSPPKEFFVQIDTGSDALWVSCKSCTGCSQTNNYYDESLSSTSSLISCSDRLCSRAATTCTSDRQTQCSYTLHHSSGTIAAGYYVSDVIHLNINGTSEAPPSILFGCSTSIAQPQGGLDGVLGFGRQSFSVINQLDSLGVAAHVFSHCLDSVAGGGVLTIGYPQEPEIVYTPLVRDVIKYEINLESVSVNGHTLPINQSILRQGRTIVDSGTTFAYLARGAFLHLLDAITKVAPDYAQPTIRNGIQCYMSNYSILGRFPGVSLNFADNASMHLRQQDYLVQQQSQGDTEVWCIGFRESTNQDTILGDLVLKDKLIVYDLERQRIGWANHDCSPYINATTTAPSSGVTSEPEILLKLLALLFVSSFSLGIM